MRSLEIKIRLFDTDLFGRTHFSSFFRYIDIASTEFFESEGIDPSKTLKYLPVAESGCRFRAPTQFGDLLDARVSLSELKDKALRLLFRFYRKPDDILVAEGYQVLVYVNEEGKAATIPKEMI